MALAKELLTVLNNTNEPFCKRIKIAENAFKSTDLPLQHKEVFLFKWVIKCPSTKESLETLNNWINSSQFNELNRNDIDSEDIKTIIELIVEKISQLENDNATIKTILGPLILFTENRIVQQYFKHNLADYCQLISAILHKIECSNYFSECIGGGLFHKNVMLHETFHKYFLEFTLPTLINCILKFDNQISVFQEVSSLVQKCIFHRNHKPFGLFINQFFDESKVEKQPVPKMLFKYLQQFYRSKEEVAKIQFRVIFHAFLVSYDTDSELLYKFFVLLIHMFGFNLNQKLILYKALKLEIVETSLNKSQCLILELLTILSETKNGIDCKINDISFMDFIKNLLKQFLHFNMPMDTTYKIFIKAITINPLVIQSITENIIIYSMMANNKNQKEYENVIIAMFEVYSKLHRIENFISKMVQVLNDGFNGNIVVQDEVYNFKGDRDVKVSEVKEINFRVDEILTKNILDYFSKCICNLASWQVINVFKTLLYHLNANLNDTDNIKNARNTFYTFVAILSEFIVNFLSSIRVAEHTVTTSVVEKTVKNLEELKNLLKQFGTILLNKEHNHMLMKSFLNIAYNWAEVYMSLEYYSVKNEVSFCKPLNNDFTSCNITYLHSYLNVNEWCLISERITNFGEQPCKLLLQKLYVQKLRAITLFERNINSDITSNIVRSLTAHLEENWRDILQDKYIINFLLNQMDSSSIIFLAENLVDNIDEYLTHQHIVNSTLLLNAINYVAITRINKMLLKQKRKHKDILKKTVSTKIYSTFTDDLFFHYGVYDIIIENVKQLYHSKIDNPNGSLTVNEDAINNLFSVLKKSPIIFSFESAQQAYLLYLFSLHKDFSTEFLKGNYGQLQTNIETIIIGVLQQYKFKLTDIFMMEVLCREVVENFKEWNQIFSLVTDNVFKYETSIKSYKPVVLQFSDKLLLSKYMHCCITIMNTVVKVKKSKLSKDEKNLAEEYKTDICDQVLCLVSEHSPNDTLVGGYVYALRNFLAQNCDDKLNIMLEHVNTYVEFALENRNSYENIGYLKLFITILQNKTRFNLVKDDFMHKVWNACLENDKIYYRFDEYSQLVVLILEHILTEEFTIVTEDLLNITAKSLNNKDFELFGKHLKTWRCILTCNFNSLKIKILQGVLERLLQKLIIFLQVPVYHKELYHTVLKFENTIIQTTHLHLTPSMIDMFLLNVTLLVDKEDEDFQTIYDLSVSLLSCLLKYRKPLIMDRLPPYLQQYRILLNILCKRSNSDINKDAIIVQQISDCAHQLEKLTKSLVINQKDMGRIAMFLIADILEQYERVTLYPNVKIHLNNCIYTLMAVCDQHATAYLMRALSSASTEIFKIMYENYKKYYRFTGKI